MSVVVSVQSQPFDLAAEVERVKRPADDVGAVVSFSGTCRSDGGRLLALELEHYPGMAEVEIERIAEEAKTRWPLSAVTVIHRFGRIPAGDDIVLVITASQHRGPAFEAASFIMDYMKTHAPFWKREHLADGTTGEWIAARRADDDATARWQD